MDVSIALPTSVYHLDKCMGTPELVSNMRKFVVCHNCLSLYRTSQSVLIQHFMYLHQDDVPISSIGHYNLMVELYLTLLLLSWEITSTFLIVCTATLTYCLD